MYLHVVVEVVCAILIVAYVRRSTRHLQDQIRDLNKIVQQQQEMLHLHHRIFQQHGWIGGVSSSSLSNEQPKPKGIPEMESPLNVDIQDMKKLFKVPFTAEEVVILPHPSLVQCPSFAGTVHDNAYAGQTIIEEHEARLEENAPAPSPAPSIDEEIADEIQELVKEEEKVMKIVHNQDATQPPSFVDTQNGSDGTNKKEEEEEASSSTETEEQEEY